MAGVQVSICFLEISSYFQRFKSVRGSELYTAPCRLIGGLRESTGSSGQKRRARRRECLGTQGFCWGRRGLWRRGTAKKRLAGYAR